MKTKKSKIKQKIPSNKQMQLIINKLISTISFYADPVTYFAIGFNPDHPSGDFMDDFSETVMGSKPGKLARKTLVWFIKSQKS